MAKPSKFALRTQITGLDAVIKAMEGKIPASSQVRVLESTLASAVIPAVNAAKSNLAKNGSIRTGALHKSLGAVVRKYNKGNTFVAIVGAKKGSFGAKKKGKGGYSLRKLGRGGIKANEEKVTPEKYIHLVELGHASVHGGGALRGGREGPLQKGVWNAVNKNLTIREATIHETSYIPPKPFLRPAFEETKDQIKNAISSGFSKALADEARRQIKLLARKMNTSVKTLTR